MHLNPSPQLIACLAGMVVLLIPTYYDLKTKHVAKWLYWICSFVIYIVSWLIFHNIWLEGISFAIAVYLSLILAWMTKKHGHNFMGAVDINIIVLVFVLLQGYTIAVITVAAACYLGWALIFKEQKVPFFGCVMLGLIITSLLLVVH